MVGGGFGGLEVVRGLRRAPVDITLVDRRNHFLFQPLLYQVATAGLSPAQIAAPIRGIVGGQANVRVLMGEAVGVDAARRALRLADGELEYDYLVLAAGATHSYFGNDAWEAHAPGLKTVEDALEIRRRFLLAFERAEREPNESARRAWLTFVIVGAGPTGVEMAGAMQEIALRSIPADFRAIDTTAARVVLVEAQDRVLAGGFPAALSARALRDLRRMGVDVRLSTRVVAIDENGVTLRAPAGEDRIGARNVIWAAGVRASGLGASLREGTGVELDRSGRVVVGPDLAVPGRPEIFVIGDMAEVKDAKTGAPVPGMAPGAMQMGRFVGAIIASESRDENRPRPAFTYRDKGLLATIGRNRAVARLMGMNFGGFAAWAIWAVVHITALIGFRSKVLVLIDWVWSYVFFSRGARLITEEGTEASRHRGIE